MFSLRCPNCGKTVQMPAQFCPHCKIELRLATEPKPKPPIWRKLAALIVILLCASVIYYLVQKLLNRGAFESLRKYGHSIESVSPATDGSASIRVFSSEA